MQINNGAKHSLHLVYANPRQEGFLHELFLKVVERANSAGIAVDIFDLYAMEFNPILNSSELDTYLSKSIPDDVRPIASSLTRCETLFYIYPVWMYFLPSILKGYFEKVWRPNVSFSIENGAVEPRLHNIKKIFVICASGQKPIATDDLCEAFFNKLIIQNTLPETKLNYLIFAGRDTAKNPSFQSQQDQADFEELLAEL